jgi:hypothetical protein
MMGVHIGMNGLKRIRGRHFISNYLSPEQLNRISGRIVSNGEAYIDWDVLQEGMQTIAWPLCMMTPPEQPEFQLMFEEYSPAFINRDEAGAQTFLPRIPFTPIISRIFKSIISAVD